MAVQSGVIYGNDDGNESKVASRTVGISVILGTAAVSYVVAVSGLLPARSGERIHLADALLLRGHRRLPAARRQLCLQLDV